MSRCILLFFLAAFLPLVRPKAGGSEQQREDDIEQFLNATGKLWVYNTTEGKTNGSTICRYDVKHNQSAESIWFYRHDEKGKILLKGDFINWNDFEDKPKDAILVKDAAGHEVGAAVLEYANENKSCAVFSVSVYRKDPYGQDTYRELRLTQHALNGGPDSKCLEKFKQILKDAGNKETMSHYSESCQNKLRTLRR